jgi:hypothetical protein
MPLVSTANSPPKAGAASTRMQIGAKVGRNIPC